MADEIKTAFDTAFREYVTDGVPGSGAHKPQKAQIRDAGTVIQEQVDAVALLAGSGAKAPVAVKVISTANVTIATGLENGDTVDGVVMTTGDIVLLTAQSTASQNGPYTVVASGAASRTTGYTTGAGLFRSSFAATAGGRAGQVWAITNATEPTVGVTDITTAYSYTTTALADESVTNAKMANMAEGTVKMRRAATGTGDPTDTTLADLKTDLALNNVDNTSDANKPVSTAQAAADTALSNRLVPVEEVVTREDVSGAAVVWRDDFGNIAMQIDDDGALRVHTLRAQFAEIDSMGESVAEIDVLQVFRDVNHIILYGQSLANGSDAGPALSTTDQPDALMFSGGPRPWFPSDDRASFDDYHEVLTELWFSGALEMFRQLLDDEDGITVSDKTWKWLCSGSAQSGAQIEALEKGGSYYPRIEDDLTAGAALTDAADDSYAVAAIIWGQGESNQGISTRDWYRDELENGIRKVIEADAKAATNQAEGVPLFTYQTVSHDLASVAIPEVALGQLNAHIEYPNIIMATPAYPFDFVNIHMSNVGSKSIGAYFGLAMKRVLWDRVPFDILRPIYTARQGKTVMIKFNVPKPPIVFDTTYVTAQTNMGFELKDSAGGALTVSSVEIIDPYTVKLTAAADIPSGAKVTYAWKFGDLTKSGRANGARGNLRDSQGDTIIFDAASINRPMHNWAPIFEEVLA